VRDTSQLFAAVYEPMPNLFAKHAAIEHRETP
jgi:hypothetical protein